MKGSYLYYEGDLLGEIWKPITGYEGNYSISNMGRVMSHGRPNHHDPRIKRDRILPHQIAGENCYYFVNLRKNGTHKLYFIHRLVAQAFIPNPENKRTVNHIDGNKSNYSISNLEWSTHKENIRHAWDSGLSKVHKSHNQKISNDGLEDIKKMISEKKPTKEIAEKYSVTPSHIRGIMCGSKRSKIYNY